MINLKSAERSVFNQLVEARKVVKRRKSMVRLNARSKEEIDIMIVRALREDWEAVGRDMRLSMKAIDCLVEEKAAAGKQTNDDA